MGQAAEQRTFERAKADWPTAVQHARNVVDRVRGVHDLPNGARIVDIGAAQGLFIAACAQMGFDAIGIEPWIEAHEIAEQMASHHGVSTTILPGVMEAIPLPEESVDFVHANSVVEHVNDVERSFSEVYRILKPGSAFWFATASSLCPRQGEIRGFPLFGWYPNVLKRYVMDWALRHKPQLIGHTQTPAYHWFTPSKARRMLADAGFRRVYDRWDLRLPSEGGANYRRALRLIKRSRAAKLIADVCVPTCSYLAVK